MEFLVWNEKRVGKEVNSLIRNKRHMLIRLKNFVVGRLRLLYHEDSNLTGCGKVWLIRQFWKLEILGSNPSTLTNLEVLPVV